MYKLAYLIIFLFLTSCSSTNVGIKESTFIDKVIFNSLIKNDVDLLSEKPLTDEIKCLLSIDPYHVGYLIKEPQNYFLPNSPNWSLGSFRMFNYYSDETFRDLLETNYEIRPDHSKSKIMVNQKMLSYKLKDLYQLSKVWKDEIISKNILLDCKKSYVKSFYTALKDYDPQEVDGINFKKEYTDILERNFFSSSKTYNLKTYSLKSIDKHKVEKKIKKDPFINKEKKERKYTYNDSEATFNKNKQEDFNDKFSPTISINEAKKVNKKGIIKGKVVDDNEVAEFYINDRLIALDKDGNFKHEFFIPQNGINLSLVAYDITGKKTESKIEFKRKTMLNN